MNYKFAKSLFSIINTSLLQNKEIFIINAKGLSKNMKLNKKLLYSIIRVNKEEIKNLDIKLKEIDEKEYYEDLKKNINPYFLQL
jgi:hypothetical protein